MYSFDKNIPLNSINGKPLFFYEQHLYYEFRKTPKGDMVTYRCRIKTCSGCLQLDQNTLSKTISSGHRGQDCVVNNNDYIIMQAKQQYLNAVLGPSNPQKELIYMSFYHSLKDPGKTSEEFVRSNYWAHFPNEVKLSKVISRKCALIRGPVPVTIDGLHCPDIYTKTKDGRNFLLYKFDKDEKNIYKQLVIFSTIPFFELLCNSERVSIDGTFKTVPDVYKKCIKNHSPQVSN